MDRSQGTRPLKRDVFGRIERDRVGGVEVVRRHAEGSRVPFSRFVARRLLSRERAALAHLDGLIGVPRLVSGEDGATRGVLTRSYVEGTALSEATWLPENFFDELDRLVEAVHARGVCHNDLHKEQNVLVDVDGYPWLVDFQLASVHAVRDRTFASRALEDLRHVEKHRRRYTRDGRGPRGERTHGRGAGVTRSWIARTWRRAGKPVYNFVTRKLVRPAATEVRRPITGPWPEWRAAIEPRRFLDAASSTR